MISLQVIMSYGSTFKLHFAAVFAYGVPLVIVLLNAGITLGHIDRDISGTHMLDLPS